MQKFKTVKNARDKKSEKKYKGTTVRPNYPALYRL